MSLVKGGLLVAGLGGIATAIGLGINSLSSSDPELKKTTVKEKLDSDSNINLLDFDDESSTPLWQSKLDRYRVEARNSRNVSMEQFKSGCRKLLNSEANERNMYLIWDWCSK